MSARRIARYLGLDAVDRPTLWVFVAAVLISGWARFAVAPHIPLWLDEAWTGGIAGQSTWGETIRQTWLDANAPLYYAIMHVWIGLFGASNEVMRFPSLVFGLLTPFLPLVIRIDGWRTEDRLAMGALLAVWTQGIILAQEARCYTLLILLATAQTLCFARLLTGPSTRRALVWALLCSLVIVTHYQALALGAVQGLIYLATHRLKAVKTWPAVLGFAPGFAVLAWHLPRLLQFARPDVAWYDVATLDTLASVGIFLGDSWWLYALPVIGVLYLLGRALWRRPLMAAQAGRPALWLAGLSAVIGLAIVFGAGMVRPSFTLRYATPFLPGVIMLFCLGVRAVSVPFPAARVGLMLMALLHCADWSTASAGKIWRYFTYEAASRDLLATHPTRLVFIWDHPAQQVEDPSQYVAAGGFFFRRAGSNVPVTPVMVRGDEDPNIALTKAASAPGSVILWLYDTRVRGTAAVRFPPRITVVDPSFGCHDYGKGRFGVLACSRTWEKP